MDAQQRSISQAKPVRTTQSEGHRHCMMLRHRLQTERACVAETKNILQAYMHAARLGWQFSGVGRFPEPKLAFLR